MRRIVCRVFGHRWRARWATDASFHQCQRCGVGGDTYGNEV
ncbi:DUF1660 family phage protein [uncultured Ruegeria sp.]